MGGRDLGVGWGCGLPVDEGCVDSYEEDDGLEEEQSEGQHEMFFNEVSKVDVLFFRDVVDGEVLGFLPDPSCAFAEDGFLVGLLEEEDVEDEGQPTHDAGDVLRPAPAQVALRDECAYNWRNEWPNEYKRGEPCDCDASSLVAEEIGEGAADDGKRTRCEDAREEAAQHQCLKVFGGGAGEHEASEDQLRCCQRHFSSVQLGQRSECQRASRESADIQRQPENCNHLADTEF